MLSKEEKLKYGEILRQQMKEKEEKKRQDDMMKRGGPPSVPKVQSDRILMADPMMMNVDPKEVLQKKLETQDYNPFGKAGGGAPNLKGQQNITVNAEGNYSGLAMSNQQQYQQRRPQQPIYNSQDYAPIQQIPTQKYQNSYEIPKNEGYRPVEQAPQYQRLGNDYPPTQQYQQYPQMMQAPRMQPQYQPQYQPQPMMKGYPEQPPYQQVPYSLPSDPRIERGGGDIERVRTLQNEEMQQMYRKGGRNLLKLQNQTANEHLVKQKQKLQMQAFLKQQMQEVEHRKQMEKQKIKRQQMEEERRNRDYIEQQNQKLRDQERKKNEDRQKIVEDNVKNLAKRKELEQQAKDKLERQRLNHIQHQRRREQQEKERDHDNERQREQVQNEKMGGKVSKISREEGTQSISSTSSQHTTQGKGFNTEISRQFFKKEREREPEKFRNDKKLELFTNEIQKMRDQINNQGQMFQKEIERIKRESEQAQVQKVKAEFQIEKLKLELQMKNRQSQLKLLSALKRNDPYSYPPRQMEYQQQYDSLSEFQRTNQYHPPQQQKYIPPTPPKMPKTNKVQEYEPRPLQERQPQKNPQKQSKKSLIDDQYEPRRLDESQMMTLDGQSKKIPLSLQGNSKLTISKIENYGKDSAYYQQSRAIAKPYRKQEPIMEEAQEQRINSRKSRRGDMDELDRFVGSRQTKRWNVSTVNDDITKQIEQLLKKKDNKPNEYNKMGEAGRQVLSRGGLPYEGNLNTMSSNRISAVSNGTLDIDKVHDRNEARLRELKALGVQTVNTNNDEDLNRLNILLKNYQ